MMNDKKPGFLEGILKGLDNKSKEVDSPQVAEVKKLILARDLTAQERGDLAGWLMGESVKDIILSAMGEVPPAQ